MGWKKFSHMWIRGESWWVRKTKSLNVLMWSPNQKNPRHKHTETALTIRRILILCDPVVLLTIVSFFFLFLFVVKKIKSLWRSKRRGYQLVHAKKEEDISRVASFLFVFSLFSKSNLSKERSSLIEGNCLAMKMIHTLSLKRKQIWHSPKIEENKKPVSPPPLTLYGCVKIEQQT